MKLSRPIKQALLGLLTTLLKQFSIQVVCVNDIQVIDAVDAMWASPSQSLWFCNR
jgi:hypothetical protein